MIPDALEELQQSSALFGGIMQDIREDPCVLSLLERRKGQRGFRDLQGDSLRNTLEKILSKLVRFACIYIQCTYIHTYTYTHVHIIVF